jgi:hypothetical protein
LKLEIFGYIVPRRPIQVTREVGMAWETVAQRLRACVRVSSCLAAIPLALLLVAASAPRVRARQGHAPSALRACG